MARRYRIVFLGLMETDAQFITGMSSQFGVAPTKVKHIIESAPMVLKRDLTLGKAREYAEALQRAGGKVHIQEHGEAEAPERERVSAEIKSFGRFHVVSGMRLYPAQVGSMREVRVSIFAKPSRQRELLRTRDIGRHRKKLQMQGARIRRRTSLEE
jgi:hypothetical protein